MSVTVHGIKYVVGNIFTDLPTTSPTKFIFHVCNDIGGWGSGFVKFLSQEWTEPEASYRKWHKEGYSNGKPFKIGQFDSTLVQKSIGSGLVGSIYVVNCIGQRSTISKPECFVAENDVKRPLDYVKLASAMSELGENLRVGGKKYEIHCPLFGSGLAGGDWDIIEQLIIDAWVRQGIAVTVYQLEGQELRK